MLQELQAKLGEPADGASCQRLLDSAAGTVSPTDEDMNRLAPLLEAHEAVLVQQKESLDAAQLVWPFL